MFENSNSAIHRYFFRDANTSTYQQTFLKQSIYIYICIHLIFILDSPGCKTDIKHVNIRCILYPIPIVRRFFRVLSEHRVCGASSIMHRRRLLPPCLPGERRRIKSTNIRRKCTSFPFRRHLPPPSFVPLHHPPSPSRHTGDIPAPIFPAPLHSGSGGYPLLSGTGEGAKIIKMEGRVGLSGAGFRDAARNIDEITLRGECNADANAMVKYSECAN